MAGDLERYSRWPMVGDFYALRAPLCLGQVTHATNAFMADSILLNLWTPHSNKEEGCFLGLTVAEGDYLWYNAQFEFTANFHIEVVEGDVMLATISNRLWFVGPETNDKYIHVLATFECNDSDILMSRVYQPGAGRREPRCKSAFEHIMEDKL